MSPISRNLQFSKKSIKVVTNNQYSNTVINIRLINKLSNECQCSGKIAFKEIFNFQCILFTKSKYRHSYKFLQACIMVGDVMALCQCS